MPSPSRQRIPPLPSVRISNSRQVEQPAPPPPCQPARSLAACVFPTGRRSARGGTSSGSSATATGPSPTPPFRSPSAASPPRPALPRGPSTRARCLGRSEEHTSELQSLAYLVCRLLLEKK